MVPDSDAEGEAEGVAQARDGFAGVWIGQLRDDGAARGGSVDQHEIDSGCARAWYFQANR